MCFTTWHRLAGWTNCWKGPSTIRLRYPVFGIIWPEPEPEPDPKKRPDIRPTGTGYPVHPYNW